MTIVNIYFNSCKVTRHTKFIINNTNNNVLFVTVYNIFIIFFIKQLKANNTRAMKSLCRYKNHTVLWLQIGKLNVVSKAYFIAKTFKNSLELLNNLPFSGIILLLILPTILFRCIIYESILLEARLHISID